MDARLVLILRNHSKQDGGVYKCVVSVCLRSYKDGYCQTDKKIARNFEVTPMAGSNYLFFLILSPNVSLYRFCKHPKN